MAKKKKRLGCLFWVALVLIVVVVFLFNQKTILEVIRKTDFPALFKNKKDEPPAVSIDTTLDEVVSTTSEETPGEIVIAPVPEEHEPVEQVDQETAEDEPVEIPEEAPEQEQEQAKPNIRNANIFLVEITVDGEISLQAVSREVRFSDSPLRETLLELLKGLNRGELQKGLQTQIPPETDLLGVYIQGETAFIDFSENFRFNPLGGAGLEAQLKQVVFTTLEFNNINNVQILIEGKIRRYLGPEGISIGQPLSAESFS